MKRILFLCMGNICRSPAAHCIFQNMINHARLSDRFEVESAGTLGFHAGEPPDSRMQQALQARKIPVIGSAYQLQKNDLAYYDLILAMDNDNLEEAKKLDPTGIWNHKIQLFCKYCTEHDETEVPDPYYGGIGGFEYVTKLIEDGCANLLRQLTTDSS